MAFTEPIQSKPHIKVQRYLGVDPGLRRTGYAVIERSQSGPILREAGVIRSTAELPLSQRVLEIGQGIRDVIDDFAPQVMSIEQVFSLGRNPKSALLMAHARGAILMAAAEQSVKVVHFPPTHVKKLLTGSGRASKEQMQFAIQNELRIDVVPEPHDVADAAAIALCTYHSLQTV